MPKESQKTANKPMTIMGKKLPMTHSNTMAKTRRTGPTKKKMPLLYLLIPCLLPNVSGANLHNGRETGGASPAHENHGEGEGRDDEPGQDAY